MPRTTLDHEIQTISADLLLLSNMVEQALVVAVQSLKDHDFEKSHFVCENDKNINSKRFHLESQIINAIATQSPLTRDLRFLASCLNICTELERIGDYAKAIANANLKSGGISIPNLLIIAKKMGFQTANMLHRSITAFLQDDAETAQNIIFEDDVIDAHYRNLYEASVQRVLYDARYIQRINYLLWVAHSLERSADRVTNICERTIYVKTGSFVEDADT